MRIASVCTDRSKQGELLSEGNVSQSLDPVADDERERYRLLFLQSLSWDMVDMFGLEDLTFDALLEFICRFALDDRLD